MATILHFKTVRWHDWTALISAILTVLLVTALMIAAVFLVQERGVVLTAISIVIFGVILVTLVKIIRGFLLRNRNEKLWLLFQKSKWFFNLVIPWVVLLPGIIVVIMAIFAK